jgi:cholesterol transport system auxiliary component
VLAQHEFDTSVVSTSDDTYGGVVAANQAVQTVLARLSGFCTEAAQRWQANPGNVPNNATGRPGAG